MTGLYDLLLSMLYTEIDVATPQLHVRFTWQNKNVIFEWQLRKAFFRSGLVEESTVVIGL